MNRRAIRPTVLGGRQQMNEETNQGPANQPSTQEPQGSAIGQPPVEHAGLGGTYPPFPKELLAGQPPAGQATDAVTQTPYQQPFGAADSPRPSDPTGDQSATGGPFGRPPANLTPAHKGDSPLLLAAVFASGILTVAAIVGVYSVVK